MFNIILSAHILLLSICLSYSVSITSFKVKVNYPDVDISCKHDIAKKDFKQMTISRGGTVFYTLNSNALNKPVFKQLPGIKSCVAKGQGEFSIKYYDEKTFGAFECKVINKKNQPFSRKVKVTVTQSCSHDPLRVTIPDQKKGKIDRNAYVLGFDAQKSPVYICSFKLLGNIFFGMASANTECVLVADGEVYQNATFNVLKANGYKWVSHTDNNPPPLNSFKTQSFTIARCVVRGVTYGGTISENRFYYSDLYDRKQLSSGFGTAITGNGKLDKSKGPGECKVHEIAICP